MIIRYSSTKRNTRIRLNCANRTHNCLYNKNTHARYAWFNHCFVSCIFYEYLVCCLLFDYYVF